MGGGQQAYLEALQNLRSVAVLATGDGSRATVDRAVGLLAGRTRCRLSEAHRHLLQVAADQNRDVAEVAAGVIGMLDVAEPAEDRGPPAHCRMAGVRPAGAGLRPIEPWLAVVQAVLDLLPGHSALLTPVRDRDGRLTDLVYAATTPEAVTPRGVHGWQLVGSRMAEQFPEAVASDRWAAYARVLDTGEPVELGPFPFGDQRFTVRAHRLGTGLFLTWVRHGAAPDEGDRIAGTEQLGNLGWGEWDLVSGEVRWSAQLYRIYERDPARGPLSAEESGALLLPEDVPLQLAAAAAFERSERVDVTSRIRVNGRVKHLRTVADAVRDAAGRPLRVYGIVQDVTARETSARRLAEAEQELAEQRRSLHAEHELAARLQHIILPIPERPVELPGIKVAVRYLPAGQESLVGGDWYHAAALRDGSVLLAIGDVAGHGTLAATTMAQLRYSLRALAVTTTDPAELLGHLNRLTCDLDEERPETAATAIVARYEPALRRLTWAQAGHPPPLLSRGGRTQPLARPTGPMLGVVEDAGYECAELRLAVGDLLLLYTDGLVEHRSQGLDEGLAAVMRTVDDAVAAAPLQPLAELVNRLRQANPDDDTCILAIRPTTGETQDLRRYLRTR
jgi:serine phosphatase RsbU (regulator of sigma subunit)